MCRKNNKNKNYSKSKSIVSGTNVERPPNLDPVSKDLEFPSVSVSVSGFNAFNNPFHTKPKVACPGLPTPQNQNQHEKLQRDETRPSNANKPANADQLSELTSPFIMNDDAADSAFGASNCKPNSNSKVQLAKKADLCPLNRRNGTLNGNTKGMQIDPTVTKTQITGTKTNPKEILNRLKRAETPSSSSGNSNDKDHLKSIHVPAVPKHPTAQKLPNQNHSPPSLPPRTSTTKSYKAKVLKTVNETEKVKPGKPSLFSSSEMSGLSLEIDDTGTGLKGKTKSESEIEEDKNANENKIAVAPGTNIPTELPLFSKDEDLETQSTKRDSHKPEMSKKKQEQDVNSFSKSFTSVSRSKYKRWKRKDKEKKNKHKLKQSKNKQHPQRRTRTSFADNLSGKKRFSAPAGPHSFKDSQEDSDRSVSMLVPDAAAHASPLAQYLAAKRSLTKCINSTAQSGALEHEPSGKTSKKPLDEECEPQTSALAAISSKQSKIQVEDLSKVEVDELNDESAVQPGQANDMDTSLYLNFNKVRNGSRKMEPAQALAVDSKSKSPTAGAEVQNAKARGLKPSKAVNFVKSSRIVRKSNPGPKTPLKHSKASLGFDTLENAGTGQSHKYGAGKSRLLERRHKLESGPAKRFQARKLEKIKRRNEIIRAMIFGTDTSAQGLVDAIEKNVTSRRATPPSIDIISRHINDWISSHPPKAGEYLYYSGKKPMEDQQPIRITIPGGVRRDSDKDKTQSSSAYTAKPGVDAGRNQFVTRFQESVSGSGASSSHNYFTKYAQNKNTVTVKRIGQEQTSGNKYWKNF